MEAKIIFHEISPRIPYLKTNITDFFTISFLQNNSFVKIDDLENYLNKTEPIILPIMNISQKEIHFYLIKNGINIIGMGEIPLINATKWFDLKEFSANKKNSEEKLSTISNNDDISQQIINSYNIKLKLSVNIIRNNNEDSNNNLNSLLNTISKEVIADSNSNSNSISNTCSNSKIPPINKSKDVLLTKKNNILLKSKNKKYKKIEMYKKNNSNNCTLFSSINNNLLRNQTEKKFTNITGSEKKTRIFSFNNYYDINNNCKEKDNFPTEKSSYTNMLSLANNKKETKDINNDISIKRKKILKTIKKLSNISNITDSFKIKRQCTSPKNDILSYKKYSNNSKAKTIIRNIDSWKKNLFWTQNEKQEKEKEKENIEKKIKQENLNNNSFKKIEDVIIDQNFKNEIKNDEFLASTNNNNNSLISSFCSSTYNYFYETANEDNHILFNSSDQIDDILVNEFNDKKNELLKEYTLNFIGSVKSDLLFRELQKFIYKIIELENEYQKRYKDLYNNSIKNKEYINLFKLLYLQTIKKKNKLNYVNTSSSLRDNKIELINPSFKLFNNSRINLISNSQIPFWNNLMFIENENNQTYIPKENGKKIMLVQIFLNICQKNNKYFNSLSKKCYNDIKSKYCKEKENKVIKTYYTRYCSPTKFNQINQNDSSLNMKKYSTKNYFYPSENMKNSKNKIKSYKNSNFKKEGLVIEGYKTSSLFNKNVKKK